MSGEWVAIVDAYSSANQFAGAFKERGYPCVHVQSRSPIPDCYMKSFMPTDFEVNVVHDGDLRRTIAELKKLGVKHVIAGIETGVELADQLSEAMGLVTNGTRMSPPRRNKFEMMEAVRKHGLRAIRSMKAKSPSAIIGWMKENKFEKVVIKPLESAGNDNVAVCSNEAQVLEAFLAIFGNVNRLGLLNKEVLAQELIEGTEYVVNTVNHPEKRAVTDVIICRKVRIEDGSILYDRDDYLTEIGPTEKSLIEYTFGVLDALEINHGPGHAELFMTKDGPVLTEIAARIDGTTYRTLSREVGGASQVELTVASYINPEEFLNSPPPVLAVKHRVLICLISQSEGIIEDMPGIREIENLPSFYEISLKVELGGRLRKTRDVFTTPAYVFLIHSDRVILDKDYETLRDLEKKGLFTISSSDLHEASNIPLQGHRT